MYREDELFNVAMRVQTLRAQFTDINDKINTYSDRISSLEEELKAWGYFTPQRKEMTAEVASLKAELANFKKEESLINKELAQYPSFEELKSQMTAMGFDIDNYASKTMDEDDMLEIVEEKQSNRVIPSKTAPDFIIKAAEAESKSINDAKQKYKSLKNVRVGDKIKFGEYYHFSKAQKEEIEWQVLAKKGKKILVLTAYAIDCKPFNKTDKVTTWGDSSIRKWLNDEFYKEAFTIGERNLINTVTVTPDKNSNYATFPGFKTKDQLFLLSIPETKRYIGRKGLDCKPTEYAKRMDAYVDEDNGNCWWWLRTPGEKPTDAAYVGVDGTVRHAGDTIYIGCGSVRPALWIDLSLLK